MEAKRGEEVEVWSSGLEQGEEEMSMSMEEGREWKERKGKEGVGSAWAEVGGELMVLYGRKGRGSLWWPELRTAIGEGGGGIFVILSHGMADLVSYGNAHRDIDQVLFLSLSVSFFFFF